MFLPQANVKYATCSCTRIHQTPGKISGMERYGATPRDTSSSKTNSRLSFQSPSFVVTSVSPAQFRYEDIVSPRHPGSIINRDKSAESFNARINGSLGKNSDYTSFFSHVVGLEGVSGEVADFDASKRMNFASNPVLGETPKFVALRLSTINTGEKLNAVFAPATRAGELTYHSDWVVLRYNIAEFTADRVSKAKAYINYIKNYEFETMSLLSGKIILGFDSLKIILGLD